MYIELSNMCFMTLVDEILFTCTSGETLPQFSSFFLFLISSLKIFLKYLQIHVAY